MSKLSENKKKYYAAIREVYESLKQADIPDTYIVRAKFPEYHIFISYRTWVRIKGKKPEELKVDSTQLSLF